MKTIQRPILAGLLVAALPVAAAGAASPTPGARYSGPLKKSQAAARPQIILDVSSSGTKLTAILDCGDTGGSYEFKNVKVDSSGAFAKAGKLKGAPYDLEGSFKSASQAKGTLETVICFVGDSATFTAKAAG